jgi:hypothetical protein
MSITIKYDFFSDHTLTAVAEVCEIANVTPLSVTFNSTEFDNISVEFVDQKDAILFSEVYLGSTDPSDVREYVGSETPLGEEVYGG